MDVLASHGARIRTLADQVGLVVVEDFIDQVQSVDNLLDLGALDRARGKPGNAPPLGDSAPERDILGHLLLHAPFEEWQQEVLAMLRDEAYYFLPQMLTKIMNEGWASFWHSRLMTGKPAARRRDRRLRRSAQRGHGGHRGPHEPLQAGHRAVPPHRSRRRRQRQGALTSCSRCGPSTTT